MIRFVMINFRRKTNAIISAPFNFKPVVVYFTVFLHYSFSHHPTKKGQPPALSQMIALSFFDSDGFKLLPIYFV